MYVVGRPKKGKQAQSRIGPVWGASARQAQLECVPGYSPPSWASGLRACTSVHTDVVVLEVSNSLAQPSLFYHLGVRQSFSMTNNVLLCSQAELPDLQALRVGGLWWVGQVRGWGEGFLEY